jgi:hypothetical protein
MREADNLTTFTCRCHEIWEPKPPGTLWATPGLLRDCFTSCTTSVAMVSCHLESCLVGCSEIVQRVWIMSREWWMHARFLLASSYSVAVIPVSAGNFYV